MADRSGQPEPDRASGTTTVEASDLQDLNRTGGDLADQLIGDSEKPTVDRAEPEITVGGERSETLEQFDRRAERVEPQDEREQRLNNALATIERMNSENAAQRERIARLEGFAVSGMQGRAEPEIEFVEIIPGSNVRLPKNPEQWPIQLTPEMVSAVGINPETAPGLNTLANAFFVLVSNAVSKSTIEALEGRGRAASERRAAVSAFESAFPDLREHTDLLDAIETRMFQSGVHQGKTHAQFAAELATRARSRIASLRGLTLDQYVEDLRVNGVGRNDNGGGGGTRTTPRSRATFGSSGGRTPRPVRSLDNEMTEMQKF